MNASAREIALHALRNYLVGDLELTPADAGEVITVALARALARAVAEREGLDDADSNARCNPENEPSACVRSRFGGS